MEKFQEEILPYLAAPRLPRKQARAIMDRTVERYREPWRRHHVVKHLGDMSIFLLENVDNLQKPRVVFWSMLFHDAVYVPSAGKRVNEEYSALLAEQQLQERLPDDEVSEIKYNIRATADHLGAPGRSDLNYLLDADMSPLGGNREEFDQYDANIEAEYVAEPPFGYDRGVYLIGRERFMRNCDYQRPLFLTPEGYDQYEHQARANVCRRWEELHSLNGLQD